jgi:Flp pilus assembly secretin CpaC
MMVCSVVGVIVTAAAIFGAYYKVAEPTIFAFYGVIAAFVVGGILAFAVPGKPVDRTTFTELTESEAGPVKL